MTAGMRVPQRRALMNGSASPAQAGLAAAIFLLVLCSSSHASLAQQLDDTSTKPPPSSTATEGSPAAPTGEPSIPVATANGVNLQTTAEYERMARSLGHLPVMSATYVFGRSIPRPATDQNGHVVVLTQQEIEQEQKQASEAAPVVAQPPSATPARAAEPIAPSPTQAAGQAIAGRIPVVTTGGMTWMTDAEYSALAQTLGHLPVLPKAYVFGHKIPLPKTDNAGHIRVSDSVRPAPTATAAGPSTPSSSPTHSDP